jgi:acetyltransferase-like isoleucine patch superfamily enzyme
MNPSDPIQSNLNPTFYSAPPASYPFSKKWHPRLQAVSVLLLGWMPSGLGAALRRSLYSRFFQRMGAGTKIAKNVAFSRMENIEMGEGVSIAPDCILSSSAVGNGKIVLDSAVLLLRGVSLQSSGEQGQIALQNRVMLERGVDIRTCDGGQIKIGRETVLGPYTCVAGDGNVEIGEYCLIASHCGIYANQHIFADRTVPIMRQGVTTKGIVIENDCWLGTGVKVMDGVRIGRGSVVGAGAVVTRDIPPYSIAVGVPARVIRTR